MHEERLSLFSTVAGTNLTTSVERSELVLRWLKALCCSDRSYPTPSLPSFVYMPPLWRRVFRTFMTFGFYVALRPRRRDNLLGTGTEWERARVIGSTAETAPKKTGETVDRRQNNGSVKAVSPRHCPATCALRNCSFNCCAGQSH